MSNEKTIKVIEFSGKKKDWDFWEEKFIARASRRGYKEVLTCKPTEIPKDSEVLDPTKAADKEKIKKKKLNSLAFEELFLSIDISESAGKVAFRIVKQCKDKTDYPDGNAAPPWKRLTEKYA